jgi:hypothetical protein
LRRGPESAPNRDEAERLTRAHMNRGQMLDDYS